MAKTVYDVLTAAAKYDGSKTAHKDVIDCLNKHGHHAKMSDAWCTETIMAILYDAGCIDLVGGYSQVSDSLVKKRRNSESGTKAHLAFCPVTLWFTVTETTRTTRSWLLVRLCVYPAIIEKSAKTHVHGGSGRVGACSDMSARSTPPCRRWTTCKSPSALAM